MPADTAQMRGVFTIPVTPFDDDGDIHEDSLRRCVQFCVDAGAHGVVAPVNASEAPLLLEQERLRVARIVVETVDHRVPVVVGVSAATTRLSQMFAQHAREIGADAVMAMPPYARKPSGDELLEYFRVVAASAHLPVFVQNYSGPAGTPMAAAFMARLIQEIDGAEYIKEETLPAGHVMSETFQLAGPRLKGIMGGMAGRFMLDEFARGACGTMPACEVTDVHVAIWDALDSGDLARARALHNRLIPLLNIEWMYGPAMYKEVLRRRGVIDSAKVRGPGAVELDAADHRELDAILADVSQLFTAAPLASGNGVAAGKA
jgi:dihydrodipicolinate synthase/N-acetylneuraminate lyase